jgi:hypothetical protein
MSVYIVTGVKLDKIGNVAEALVTQVDPRTRMAVGEPVLLPAHEAASLILQDNKLCSVFPVDGQTVLGPDFIYAEYGQGREGIQLERHEAGRTLQDLPQIE